MAVRSGKWQLVLLLAFHGMIPASYAQHPLPTAVAVSDSAVALTGIRTDRLTPRQLRTWRAIEGIVLEKDAFGQIAHPRLYGLWQWAETSGRVIYVEFRDPKARGDREAGRFMIEKSDPDGRAQTALIWLCLPIIDQTLVKDRVPGTDAFIRFEGLGRKERYAEILGHELAHAAWTSDDPGNVRLLEELERLTGEFHRYTRAARGTTLDERAQILLQRIESVTARIERPAETAEAEIWRELPKKR